MSPERRDLVELAQRAGHGDPVALSGLIRATSQQIWWACAALVDRESADDLAQETFLRAVRSLPGYRGEADPLRWLLTIARRVCAGEIARRQRARQIAARVAADSTASVPGPAMGVEMAEAIARLPTARREAFLLTAVAGFSYAETAAVCGCPVGTVRSRISRARAELVDMLELSGLPDATHDDVGEEAVVIER